MDAETLEAVACPNCSCKDSALWAREAGFSAVKCGDCGLVFVSPRPKAAEITEANRVGVHRTEDGGALAVTFRRSPRKISRYSRVLRALLADEMRQGRPITWLDVGAGYGEVVEAAAAALPAGSSAEGIEPMLPKVRVAQAQGLAVTDRSLSQVSGKYDVVSLINVLSHIPDFDQFGAEVAAKVKPGGVLVIETGNGGDLRRRQDYPDRLYLPDHLVFAGEDHVRQMVGRLGFTVEAVRHERVDGPVWALKQALRGRPSLPYTSPFRTVFYKCRKAA